MSAVTNVTVQDSQAYVDRATVLIKRIGNMFLGEVFRQDVSLRCRQLVAIDLVSLAARLLNDALNFSEPEKAYEEIKKMAAMCDTKSRLRMLSLIHGGGLIDQVAHNIPDDVYIAVAYQKLDSVFTAASILLDRAESLSVQPHA